MSFTKYLVNKTRGAPPGKTGIERGKPVRPLYSQVCLHTETQYKPVPFTVGILEAHEAQGPGFKSCRAVFRSTFGAERTACERAKFHQNRRAQGGLNPTRDTKVRHVQDWEYLELVCTIGSATPPACRKCPENEGVS